MTDQAKLSGMTETMGFAQHLSEAISELEKAINAEPSDSRKYALELLKEVDRICWLVSANNQQDTRPLADKCMICDAALTEGNVSKHQRDIHAECYERLAV